MLRFIAIPITILLFVTPLSMSLRGIFNSIRKYSATNLELVGLLAAKLRLKIENNSIYYSINNKDAKVIKTTDNKKKKHFEFKYLLRYIEIDRLHISIDYGIGGNAMRTAIESSSIYNLIMLFSNFITIRDLNVRVNPIYDNDILAIDLDIKVRFALLQILLILLHMLKDRRLIWKTSNA